MMRVLKLKNIVCSRKISSMTVSMIPGDGVGPELMHSVKEVFRNTAIPVNFEEHHISDMSYFEDSTRLKDAIESVKKNKVGIKGPLSYSTEDSELKSVNQKLRLGLDLFANVVKCKSIEGLNTRHNNVDIAVIREQTEGEYSALEHESLPGVVECFKVITKSNSMRIAKFAFDYATRHNRKKVTAIHKANIMKLSDGLFLECCAEISKMYPKIEFESMIVDNTCMQLVKNPYHFDVMVTPNLYGNIVDNVVSGLVGGAGIVAGASYSSDFVLFEVGARHSFATAMGKNIANPTAMLFAASLMLRHLHLDDYAERLSRSVEAVIMEGKVRTKDMGGHATNTDFTRAVIAATH